MTELSSFTKMIGSRKDVIRSRLFHPYLEDSESTFWATTATYLPIIAPSLFFNLWGLAI